MRVPPSPSNTISALLQEAVLDPIRISPHCFKHGPTTSPPRAASVVSDIFEIFSLNVLRKGKITAKCWVKVSAPLFRLHRQLSNWHSGNPLGELTSNMRRLMRGTNTRGTGAVARKWPLSTRYRSYGCAGSCNCYSTQLRASETIAQWCPSRLMTCWRPRQSISTIPPILVSKAISRMTNPRQIWLYRDFWLESLGLFPQSRSYCISIVTL